MPVRAGAPARRLQDLDFDDDLPGPEVAGVCVGALRAEESGSATLRAPDVDARSLCTRVAEQRCAC